MFSDTDEAYEAASRLMAATPEQLETHAVAMALRLNQAGEQFVLAMNEADEGGRLMPINKAELYGNFQGSVDRREKLQNDITRKALDLPREDDMGDVTVNNGVSGKALAGILAGMVAATGGGAIVMNQVMQQPTAPQAIVQPADMDFTIRHRNSDNEIINVPQWKPGAQE